MQGVGDGPAVNTLEALQSKRPQQAAESLIELFRKEQQSMAAIISLMATQGDELNGKELSKQKFTGEYVAVGPSKHFELFIKQENPLPRLYVMCTREEGSKTLVPVGFCCSITKAQENGKLTDMREGATFEKVTEVLTIEEADRSYAFRRPSDGGGVPWRLMVEVVMGVAIIALLVSRRSPVLPSQALAVGTTRV